LTEQEGNKDLNIGLRKRNVKESSKESINDSLNDEDNDQSGEEDPEEAGDCDTPEIGASGDNGLDWSDFNVNFHSSTPDITSVEF
jgi:hypothetical protein